MPDTKTEEKKATDPPNVNQDPVKSSKPVDSMNSKDNEENDATTEKETEETSTSNNQKSFGGWFSSIVQTAKQTVSKTTMESIKRDLTELKDAVQHDTTNMVYSTASLVKNTLNEIGNSVSEIGSLGTNNDDLVELTKSDDEKTETEESDQSTGDQIKLSPSLPFDLKTINSWTNKITDTAKSTMTKVKDTLVDSIFATFPIEELDDEPFVLVNGEIVKIENWKEMLNQLKIDPNTYTREPTGLLEDYDNWLLKFNLLNYQKQNEYLLETVPEIKKYHDELVPKTISDSEFWHRYYYKVYQLKEEQAKLIRKQQQQQQQKQKSTESNDTKSTTTAMKNNGNNNIVAGTEVNDGAISRSSTDQEWEKINNNNSDKNSKCSSDDDREWVKYDNDMK